jgi:hypothetical protein
MTPMNEPLHEIRVIFAVLEFGSPAMLGWIAAAATPFLINFWIKRRHVVTPWAAVELLAAAVRERSRQIRLREWLLLVMRSAILLLAALAAAQPAWKSTATASDARQRTHHVIVIDQSGSMACTVGTETRIDRARERARGLVQEVPTGDAVTVIAWAERAENILGRPSFEVSRVLAAIDRIDVVDTVADLREALRAVNAAIDRAAQECPSLSKTRVEFITDAAANPWSADLSRRNNSPTTSPNDETRRLWDELSAKAAVAIDSVDESARDNLAIVDITSEPVVPLLAQPAAINVRLAAFGKRAWQGVTVETWVDGVKVGEKTTAVTPDGNATATFETRIREPGNHLIEARLQSFTDALASDNRRWLSIEARDKRRVICFGDDPTSAEDVARALNPHFREGTTGSATAVELAPMANLANTNIAEYDAVWLGNVAELSQHEQQMLVRYVASGGALAIILGPQTKPAAFNQFCESHLAEPDGPDEALMPISIADEPLSGDLRLDPLNYRHPVLAPFEGRSRAGLLGVHVSKYFPLKIIDNERVEKAVGLTSGDPAIVVANCGSGRLAVMSFDPSLHGSEEPWSTLAISPSFVPLMRELFAYVSSTRRSEQLNRLAGEALLADVKIDSGGHSGEWRTPDGRLRATPPESRRCGVYRFQGAKSVEGKAESEQELSFAVNIDPRESDLTTVDIRDLASGRAIDSSNGLGSAESRIKSISFSQGLLATAAILLLVELATAWALGRGWA